MLMDSVSILKPFKVNAKMVFRAAEFLLRILHLIVNRGLIFLLDTVLLKWHAYVLIIHSNNLFYG
jgi:hypothetical protein